MVDTCEDIIVGRTLVGVRTMTVLETCTEVYAECLILRKEEVHVGTESVTVVAWA